MRERGQQPSRRSARVQAQKDEEEATEVVYPSKFNAQAVVKQHPSRFNAVELSEFILFSKLPFELREIIWVYAVPGPRTIRIVTDTKAIQQADNPWDVLVARAAPHKLPSILQVDQQSRAVGLRFYRLAFCYQLGHRPVMFNFNTDTLLLETPLAIASFFGEFPGFAADREEFWDSVEMMEDVQENLRYLALGSSSWYSILISELFQLEELIIVTPDGKKPADWWKERLARVRQAGYNVPLLVTHTKEGFEARMQQALALNPF